MLRFREILVTTDLSPESLTAFSLARDLAEASDAQIALITVIEFPAQLRFLSVEAPGVMLDASFRQTVEQITEQAKKALDGIAKSLGPRCKEKLAIEGASAAHEIIRVATERNSDIIVISTHGRTGLARVALGSTAERVVREAPCPVITVRSREPKK